MTESPSGSSSAQGAPYESDLQRITALVQHQLNNPLAALLAETQLLSMETTLDAQQRMAVERIIELVRRVIDLVRDLNSAVVAKL